MISGMEDLSDLALIQQEELVNLKRVIKDLVLLNETKKGTTSFLETDAQRQRARDMQLDQGRIVAVSRSPTALEPMQQGECSALDESLRPFKHMVDRWPSIRSHPLRLSKETVESHGDAALPLSSMGPESNIWIKVKKGEAQRCSLSSLQILDLEVKASAQELQAANGADQ